MEQPVLPIKDSNILHEVKGTLLHNFKAGRRSYAVFQAGKTMLFRVSDLLVLRRSEIFNNDGIIAKNACIRDKKAGKPSTLYPKPVGQDLKDYFQWPNQQNLHSDWLSPSTRHLDRHIAEKQLYKIMVKTGDLLGINYLGIYTMGKAGAYRVCIQTHYNIGLMMLLFNHSSEAMILKYLGLDRISREQMLDEAKFDQALPPQKTRSLTRLGPVISRFD